jgi:hypothetical protein
MNPCMQHLPTNHAWVAQQWATLLRLASLKRHARSACSTRVCCSAPDADTTTSAFADRVLAVTDGDPLDLPDLFGSLRLDAGRTASFITKSTGMASLVARPDAVRLTER